jgi:hypothetical protein
MNYRNAHNCRKCPQRNDADGCPDWWEWAETNPATGEDRIQKMCGRQALPKFLVEVIKASNRPAAAVESTRNEIVKGFVALIEMTQRLPVAEPERPAPIAPPDQS